MKKILLIGLGLVMIALLVLANLQYENAVDTCVANGQSREVCEGGLK